MKETMRSTLRSHERQRRQQREHSRHREPLAHGSPSIGWSSSPPSSVSRPSGSSPTTATTVHRRPVGSSSHAPPSIASPTSVKPVARKPVGRSSSISRQQAEETAPGKSRREKKGLVTMYREAPPGDGEILGVVVKEGWKGWQEKRKKEEKGKNVEGKSLDLKGSKDEKLCRNGNSSPSIASPRPSGRRGAVRAGTSLYGYNKHTTYEHGNTEPDELDMLVSRVTDKLSHWGKEISERSAEAKEKKMEERQRKEREALKKSISSPRPAGSSTDNSARSSLESLPCRPSFGSGESFRPYMDASKIGGSMAERMAKRGSSNFEVPFWPRSKLDRSAQNNERCTQVGDLVDSELASAPWNQHVTKPSPFSSPHSSRGSMDKERSDSPSNKFFGRFVPSPTFLFGSGSHSHAAETRRRGSDDSFFGCQGISVEEENAAQHLVHQDEREGHIESLNFRAPPTPPGGARELFGRGGHGDDDDDDDDRICYSRVSPQRPTVSDHGVDRRSVAAELVGQRQRRNGDDHEPDGDDDRVSWWDPPVTESKKKVEARTTDETGERMKHWREYRRNLRGTNVSGWEEGKPF